MGQPVATLEIEMVANIARLITDMREVKRAIGGTMDDVMSSTGRADAALGSFGRSAQDLRDRLDPMAAVHRRVNQELALAETMYRAGAITSREYAGAQQLATEAIEARSRELYGDIAAEKAHTAAVLTGQNAMISGGGRLLTSTGMQKAGMQQLSFQIADIAQGFAMGVNPMVIFAQQGSQVVQAITYMREGATGFLGFLAGPWGAGVMGAVTILGLLGPKLLSTANDSDVATNALARQTTMVDRLTQAHAELLQMLGKTGQKAMEVRGLEGVNVLKYQAELAAAQKVYSEAQRRAPGSKAGDNSLPGKSLATYLARVNELKSALGTAQAAVRLFDQRIAETRANEARAAVATTGHTTAILNHGGAVRSAATAHRVLAGAISDSARTQMAGAKAADDYIASLQKEIARFGKTAEQLKQMDIEAAADQAVRSGNMAKAREIIMLGDALADLNEQVKKAETPPVAPVVDKARELADQMERIRQAANDAGSAMASAFGPVGQAISDVIGVLTEYQRRQDEIRVATIDAGEDEQKLGVLRMQSIQNQIGGIGSLFGAAKGLFKEHSKGYQAMATAEKVLAALQLANTIRAIAMDMTHTTTSIANSTARAAADTGAGAAKMFSMTGPGGFALVPAMLGVLAAVAGIAFGGGRGGGGSSYTPPNWQDYQAKQGAGTVLGSASAQSESIANSLKLMADNTDKQLQYQNAMVGSLRAIENSMGALTSAIARQFSVTGYGDWSRQGIEKISFSKLSYATLNNAGIAFDAGRLGDLIANGITGRMFETIQLTVNKGKTTFLFDQFTAMNEEIAKQAGGVIQSIYTSIIDGAKTIGLTGIEDALAAMQIDLGRVSLKGLDGQGMTDALNAVFSAAADRLVGSVIPALLPLQKVGEGLYETLMRVAKEYQTVDVQLASIGRQFGAVGFASIAARDGLVQLFGSLDEFVSQTQFYRDNFLTKEQQIAPVISAVNAEMARLGLSGVDTIAKFKGVVDGLDLTTAAGRELYAALMAVAPGFSAVEKYQLEQVDKMKSALSAQRNEIDATVKKFADLENSLRSFKSSLTSVAAGAVTYDQQLSRLRSVGTLAALGDATALGSLEGVARDFLTLSKAGAGSQSQYMRDVALVMRYLNSAIGAAGAGKSVAQQQLDALDATVNLLGNIDQNIGDLASLLSGATVTVSQASSPTIIVAPASNTQDGSASELAALRAELAAMRGELNANTLSVATSAAITAKKLASWDDAGALKVRNDGDDALNVKVVP